MEPIGIDTPLLVSFLVLTLAALLAVVAIVFKVYTLRKEFKLKGTKPSGKSYVYLGFLAAITIVSLFVALQPSVLPHQVYGYHGKVKTITQSSYLDHWDAWVEGEGYTLIIPKSEYGESDMNKDVDLRCNKLTDDNDGVYYCHVAKSD